MEFSREITHEEMSKIAKDPGVVYVLTKAENDHGLVNKRLYRLVSTSVNIDGIRVDPETGEWSFKLRNPNYEAYKVFPTLSDVNEYIKSISKFWEVGSYNEVIGWNQPESVVLAAKQETEQMEYLRLRMGVEPPSREWRALLKAGQRELQFLDEEHYKAFEQELNAYEAKARKYYRDDN